MSRDRLTARDLITPHPETMASDRPLVEAIRRLVVGPAERTTPNAVVVVDDGGRYEGILTSKLVLRSLLSHWSPTEEVLGDRARLESDILEIVRDRAGLRVRDALVRGLPTAGPNDRLLDMIQQVTEAELEFLPVLEDGRAIGLVPVTELYYAVARLALTPDDEGIRL
jgi:CBS domain-containing protein